MVALIAATLVTNVESAWGAEPWPADCKLKLAASLPFTMEHGHILIAVQLNDKPRTFVVDTGGFLSSVSQRVVEDQSLKTHLINDNLNITGIGGQRSERYVIADTLSFGQLRAQSVRLVVSPTRAKNDIDGLIAPDYLRNFDIEFDFANQRMNLFQPHPCSDRTVYWTDHYTTLPLDITPQGHVRVRATLDGEDFEALVDTGSPATLIGARTATAKFEVTSSGEALGLSGASGGMASASLHRFHNLGLGNIIISNPTFLVSSDETWKSDSSDLLLGLNELSKFHIFLAYRSRALYLSPITTYLPQSPAR
jgi:predicted aspartyl protease